MRIWKRFLCVLVLAVAATAPAAAAVTVGNVKFEDHVDVQGQRLQLNGAGLRYKFVVKVYAAGLYVSRPAQSLAEVLAAPGPKRLSVTMLRDIDANELGKLFSRGVEDNTPRSSLSRLVPGLLRMGQVFSEHKRLAAGDTFLVDWIPGTGTVLTIKGKAQGEAFKEPEFFAAMLGIWLGNSPADYNLKEALLGRGTSASR